MEVFKKYGLLGRNIGYSFSKMYFTRKFQDLGLVNCRYEVFDYQSIEGVKNLVQQKELVGFNVTIPYKEQIIPYLDELSPEALEIGAVNTVLLKQGKTIGYNTDAFGFDKTLEENLVSPELRALILGDGGAAKAVKYVLAKRGMSFQTVSRRGALSFDAMTSRCVNRYLLIIQCTPVGTFPNLEDCLPFPFEGLGKEHLVIDLIYNPEQTAFMKKAELRGAKTVNGALMLREQAEKAWEIWNY